MLGAGHAIGVGVVASDLHQAAGDGWRVSMCPRLAGQGPGVFAGDPGESDAAPLEEQLDDVLVVVELLDEGALGVFVHAGLGQHPVDFPSGVAAKGVDAILGHGEHREGASSGVAVWIFDQLLEHKVAWLYGVFLGVAGWESSVDGSVHEPPVGREPRHVGGCAVRLSDDEVVGRVAAGGIQGAFEALLDPTVREGGHPPHGGDVDAGVDHVEQPSGDGVGLVLLRARHAAFGDFRE